MRDIFLGSDKPVSMGVFSKGAYGIEEGLVFSVPCKGLGNGKYEIIGDWELSELTKEWITKNQTELKGEFETAQEFI